MSDHRTKALCKMAASYAILCGMLRREEQTEYTKYITCEAALGVRFRRHYFGQWMNEVAQEAKCFCLIEVLQGTGLRFCDRWDHRSR